MSLRATFESTQLADRQADLGHEAPPGHVGAVPAGLALAEALVAGLGRLEEAHELRVDNRWVIPDGHAFDVRAGERFDVTLGLQGPREEGRFWLQVEARRGLMPWRRKAEPRALSRVARALHAVLEADRRVGGLRWVDSREPETRLSEPPT